MFPFRLFLPAPAFWSARSRLSDLLLPFSWLYAGAGWLRRALTTPYHAPVPVVCLGNLVMGGAGKTPVALALADLLRAGGKNVHIVSRGYGGRTVLATKVDALRHSASDVGDEALLLAGHAHPVWVARKRADGLRAAVADGADIVVMDDGFQNPTIHKDLSILVIDGRYGFGNRRIFPAGPLREPLNAGLARAHAVVVLHRDLYGVETILSPGLPRFKARLSAAGGTQTLQGVRVVAFAGIGQPWKFHRTLRELGAEVVAMHGFPDHYPYPPSALKKLEAEAVKAEARLATTAKDRMRLPEDFRSRTLCVEVAVEWENKAEIEAFLTDSGLLP